MSYPRPQLRRNNWKSLDGPWSFSFSPARPQSEVEWTHEITVPYPPESKLSGLHDEDFHPVAWYRRLFQIPAEWAGQRVRLHFGAVDYGAQVWVNGHLVATHEGGHTPFWADVTHALTGGDEEVVVRAEDDPADLAKPRGKQDWLREPHAIWYPRTTGIWQPVWLEPVPETAIESLRLTPNVADFSIGLEVELSGTEISSAAPVRLEVTLAKGDQTLVQDTLTLSGNHVARSLHLPDPGIDSARDPFLWTPESPNLLDLTFRLFQGEELVDEVKSYTALRSVAARGRSFLLNGRPYFLRLALDQGYWDDSLLAAPSDDALKKDVELAKAMGFNGVRKHQKLEDPRYLHHADRLGLLVWTELPSAYAFTSRTPERLAREWLEAIRRDYNHPCVVAWVAFNESWGVPDLPLSAPQRSLVAGLYHLTKSLDPMRPVVGNDGWEHVVSDLLTIHDYNHDPAVLLERYGTAAASLDSSLTVRSAGREVVLPDALVGASPNETLLNDAPVILSEFGGVRFAGENAGAGWGYQQVDTPEALLELYRALVASASAPGLAGFCYTQFADTFQEQNGLLFGDRTPKVALEKLYEATAQRR